MLKPTLVDAAQMEADPEIADGATADQAQFRKELQILDASVTGVAVPPDAPPTSADPMDMASLSKSLEAEAKAISVKSSDPYDEIPSSLGSCQTYADYDAQQEASGAKQTEG